MTIALVVSTLFIISLPPGRAGELDDFEPPLVATAEQRLLIEQAEQSIAAGEYEEAVAGLERLFEQGEGRLLAIGVEQRAGTLVTQRYVTLRDWTKRRLAQLLLLDESTRRAYHQRQNDRAKTAWANLASGHDVVATKLAADRFYATPMGPELGLLLADQYLESGQSVAAVQAVQQMASGLRVELPGGMGSLEWSRIWDGSQELRERFAAELAEANAQGMDQAEWLVAAAQRVNQAHAISPEYFDGERHSRWLGEVADQLPEELGSELKDSLSTWSLRMQSAQQDWSTFAGNQHRNAAVEQSFQIADRPKWTEVIDGYTASNDRTPASQPRVGELESGALPYHPLVVGGTVYLNMLTEIRAFSLETGKAWPAVRPSIPLFDSGIAPEAFMPLGYPLVGVPRATLASSEQCLYARMGQAVTGWANDEVAGDGGSQSYMVGLDLESQGRLLPGFPLRLMPPEFNGVEFDGAPCLVGDLLLAPVVERDDVGLSRSVVAFDRFSGRVEWRSGILARGSVKGIERANLISHQLISQAGSRIFFSTNLGTIACLDVATGRVEWLTRYSRADSRIKTYATPDRFRYRDLTPCLVAGGLVYCAPQDCAEIFALDMMTGDLVWSTDGSQTSDVTQLLGTFEDSLIVSGDRLVWLDRREGKLLARYPGSTTPGMVNALPAPRGLGRGAIAGSQVLWPIKNEIVIFSARLPADPGDRENAFGVAPRISNRLQLGTRGREGGNIVIHGGHMLYMAPRRIVAFAGLEKPVQATVLPPR